MDFNYFFDSLYIYCTYQKYIPFGDSSFLILLAVATCLAGVITPWAFLPRFTLLTLQHTPLHSSQKPSGIGITSWRPSYLHIPRCLQDCIEGSPTEVISSQPFSFYLLLVYNASCSSSCHPWDEACAHSSATYYLLLLEASTIQGERKENMENLWKFEEKLGKLSSCPPGTVRLAMALHSREDIWDLSDFNRLIRVYFRDLLKDFNKNLCWHTLSNIGLTDVSFAIPVIEVTVPLTKQLIDSLFQTCFWWQALGLKASECDHSPQLILNYLSECDL